MRSSFIPSSLPEAVNAPKRSLPRWARVLKIGAIVLLVLLAADLILDAIEWPFTKKATISSLEKLSECHVSIGGFHKHLFPHPGYVADAVVFTRDGKTGPITLASIQRLDCDGSWVAMLTFTHRIAKIELDGARFTIPKQVPAPLRQNVKAALPTTVTDLYASGAVLEIISDSTTSRFDFPELHLSNLGKNKAVVFHVRIANPRLIGIADVAGSVGPLKLSDVKGTRVAGTFRLSNLDLSAYQEISGMVSAAGDFKGVLKSVRIQGRVAIPDFAVKRAGHSQGLNAEYRAVVDGTRGDITINSATVHILSSVLLARGTILGDKGKAIDLHIDGQHAAVQDLLHVFASSEPPAMAGALSMQAHVAVAPGRETFLQRVRIDGDFKIVNGLFAKPETEDKVSEMSARASGHKNQRSEEVVAMQMGSRVELSHEVATLSDSFFAVPGAIVRGGGVFRLKDDSIDLRGKLTMHATLSKAASGVKSVLAIPLDPFFKKHGAGAVIPVRMTGTYNRPKFRMSL